MEQVQQVQAETTSADTEHTEQMAVRFTSGESYGVAVRGHRIQVDQPADAGGQDSAPTPTGLSVASLATRVAFYAGAT
jgi:putative redox protein